MREFRLHRNSVSAVCAFLAFPTGVLAAQPAGPGTDVDRAATYTPSADNLAARAWFQDAKFGIFIHWGVYSVLANGEWVMERRKIPAKRYERLADLFKPTRFDADAWVKTFKDAGARYVTITSKHHDGFAMYDSKVSDYDIVNRTPFERDILKELKNACDRQGVKLFVYYSQLDWHSSDYWPKGDTGRNIDDAGPLTVGNWDKYIDYQNAQLTELLTHYGKIGGVWFDGWWDQKNGDYRNRWRLAETYALIHRLQPAALIASNHHEDPWPGEDLQTFEQDLPGENITGFNSAGVSALPLETADTLNNSWGFEVNDGNFKTSRELIHRLVGAAGRNANYLLNTGPMPDGRLQPESIEAFADIGAWLRINGESVYGTRGGPVSPRPWGVTTQKGNMVYVHLLDWRDKLLVVPVEGVTAAALLADGSPVPIRAVAGGTELTLPVARLDGPDTVVKLIRAQSSGKR